MNVTRPWPSLGIGWLFALIALLLEVLLLCGVPVHRGMMIPLVFTTVALLV